MFHISCYFSFRRGDTCIFPPQYHGEWYPPGTLGILLSWSESNFWWQGLDETGPRRLGWLIWHIQKHSHRRGCCGLVSTVDVFHPVLCWFTYEMTQCFCQFLFILPYIIASRCPRVYTWSIPSGGRHQIPTTFQGKWQPEAGNRLNLIVAFTTTLAQFHNRIERTTSHRSVMLHPNDINLFRYFQPHFYIERKLFSTVTHDYGFSLNACQVQI